MKFFLGVCRTVIGVAALDPAREGPAKSPYIVSRKAGAEKMVASEVSEAVMLASRDACLLESTMLESIERNMTSSASWVKPRWDLEPSIVCVCCHPISHMHTIGRVAVENKPFLSQ